MVQFTTSKVKKTFVCGGAYSVDKFWRIARGVNWFADEQPTDRTKELCERILEQSAWKVDRVLTHTCPQRYVPTEMFLSGVDQSTVDTSTERWLDTLCERLTFEKWLCGHYHTNKSIDKMLFLFEDIVQW